MTLSYILEYFVYRESCSAQGELSFAIHIEGWSKGDLTFTFTWWPQKASGSDNRRGKVAFFDETFYLICHLWGGPWIVMVCLQPHRQFVGWRSDWKTDFWSRLRSPEYLGTTDKDQQFDYKYLSLICIFWGFCKIFEKFSLSYLDSAYSIWPQSLLKCFNLETKYFEGFNIFSDEIKLEN